MILTIFNMPTTKTCIQLQKLVRTGLVTLTLLLKMSYTCPFTSILSFFLVIFGEDVAFGGVFRCTVGLKEKYGEWRLHFVDGFQHSPVDHWKLIKNK